MKGVIEQAVIVGCDVDHCAKLLIFNRGIEHQDLDEEILRAGWLPLPQPTGDEPFQQEHACQGHAAEIREEHRAQLEEAGL